MRDKQDRQDEEGQVEHDDAPVDRSELDNIKVVTVDSIAKESAGKWYCEVSDVVNIPIDMTTGTIHYNELPVSTTIYTNLEEILDDINNMNTGIYSIHQKMKIQEKLQATIGQGMFIQNSTQ